MSQGAGACPSGDHRSSLAAGGAVKFRRFAGGRGPLDVVEGRLFVF
jgi:hypothetical protein